MRVGIVGAGRQGRRRATALRAGGSSRLTVVADIDAAAAQQFAGEFGAAAVASWRSLVRRDDVDAVIVSTPPNLHAPIALAAIGQGKHVLVEKPLAVSAAEAREMSAAAAERGVILKCGFNLRYHPAIARAHELVRAGGIGEVMFARCLYGIQGFPNFGDDWRAKPAIAGGGELLDRGVHVVDLFRWLAGEIAEVSAAVGNFSRRFHPTQEDNGFAWLRCEDGPICLMHVSSTQWRNLFTLEVYGSAGYAAVQGLGGPYGTENLRIGRREEEPGPIVEEVIEFVGPDRSWDEEWRDFERAVETGARPLGDGEDGLRSLELVEALYASLRDGATVRLRPAAAGSRMGVAAR